MIYIRNKTREKHCHSLRLAVQFLPFIIYDDMIPEYDMIKIQWYPIHNMLCFYFICLRLVYSMLPVSLDCPFLISPSVFSSIYLHQ